MDTSFEASCYRANGVVIQIRNESVLDLPRLRKLRLIIDRADTLLGDLTVQIKGAYSVGSRMISIHNAYRVESAFRDLIAGRRAADGNSRCQRAIEITGGR